MAQINVYSPLNETDLTANSRFVVQYFRERDEVTVGIQHATPDPITDGHPTYDADTGTWSNLDRAGCNSLIRALREARDKAFGRDE